MEKYNFFRYLEPGQESQNEDELSFSEEERVLEECEEYEQQYNFRFEEPDRDFVRISFDIFTKGCRRKIRIFFYSFMV